LTCGILIQGSLGISRFLGVLDSSTGVLGSSAGVLGSLIRVLGSSIEVLGISESFKGAGFL